MLCIILAVFLLSKLRGPPTVLQNRAGFFLYRLRPHYFIFLTSLFTKSQPASVSLTITRGLVSPAPGPAVEPSRKYLVLSEDILGVFSCDPSWPWGSDRTHTDPEGSIFAGASLLDSKAMTSPAAEPLAPGARLVESTVPEPRLQHMPLVFCCEELDLHQETIHGCNPSAWPSSGQHPGLPFVHIFRGQGGR